MVQLDDGQERALDDFFKSPKRSDIRMSTAGQVASVSRSGAKDPKSAQKKSTIIVSKCFNMLCGNCGKRFSSKLPHFSHTNKMYFRDHATGVKPIN